MISRLKALKNRNKQAKSWHYIYVKFPMRLCEINDLRAARRLALSKTDLTSAGRRSAISRTRNLARAKAGGLEADIRDGPGSR
jgi:hypothetical protein